MIFTVPDTDLPELSEGDAGLHVTCCRQETVFICGAPFHPEFEADQNVPRDEVDPECLATLESMVCPAAPMMKMFGIPIHLHCPLDGRRCE